MSDLDQKAADFSAKLAAQTTAARQRLDVDRAALFAAAPSLPPPPPDIESRLRAYDAQLTQRLNAAQAALTRAVSALGALPFGSGQVDLSASPDLLRLDKLFLDLFQLKRYFPSADVRYPTHYCETLAEFFTPMLAGYDLSPTQRAQWLDEYIGDAEVTARRGGGVFGVNLPGQGCYLNGWLFNYGRSSAPRELLRDAKVLSRILETAAHEKLGHGFITDFTALGAEKKVVGLQNLELAQRFNLKLADTPAQRLLIEKHNLIHRASLFTEEGWATWIGTRLHQALLQQPAAPKYTLQQVWAIVRNLPFQSKDKEQMLAALQRVFLETDLAWDDLHAAVVFLQMLAPALDDAFAEALGQPTPYVFGSLLLEKVTGRLGALAAPYAVLIACSLQYDVLRISPVDLERVVRADPKLNPDSRLAALSTLHWGPTEDMRALAAAAQEQLNIAVPAELKG